MHNSVALALKGSKLIHVFFSLCGRFRGQILIVELQLGSLYKGRGVTQETSRHPNIATNQPLNKGAIEKKSS